MRQRVAPERHWCPACGQRVGTAAPPPLVVDADRCAASAGERWHRFTPTETRVLALLAEAHPNPVPRGRIIDALYGGRIDGGPNNASNVLSIIVRRLRLALAELGWPVEIVTVHAVGYLLERTEEREAA